MVAPAAFRTHHVRTHTIWRIHMNADRLRIAIFLIVIAFSTSILSAAIATSASNVDGVTIDVTAVERKGSVLTVKWAVKNSGDKTATVQFSLTGEKVTTYLVD